jgi:hypothetical protein
MPDKNRLMLLIGTAAAITLCGAGAFGEAISSRRTTFPTHTKASHRGRSSRGQDMGALNAVAIDSDGESVWVANRCGANPDIPGESPFAYDSCADPP